MTPENQYIYFHNKTVLPVMIESWIKNSNNKHVLKTVRVRPGKKLILESIIGEWKMNSISYNIKDIEIWRHYNFPCGYNIGKFRLNPYSCNNYAILENENIFRCIYSEIYDEEITGLITLTCK